MSETVMKLRNCPACGQDRAGFVCTKEERAVLDAMARASVAALQIRELNDDAIAEACEAELTLPSPSPVRARPRA